jgi:hypothetical protein
VNRFHTSVFFITLPQACKILFRDQLFKFGDSSDAPEAELTKGKKNGGRLPNIVAILHESKFPLDLFPEIGASHKAEKLFLSGDKVVRSLTVETFGGGTWLSEYGFLLGLSINYFGSMKHYVSKFMTGKIKTSLPIELAKNGYKTIAIYPARGEYMSTRRFYQSIGFETIIDIDDMGATSWQETDAFYFQKAIEQIALHEQVEPDRPLFVWICTMSAHSPFDVKMFPERTEFDAVQAKDERWREYVRRVNLAEADYLSFKEDIKRNSTRPFLLVGFGDHQPSMTRDFLPENFGYGSSAVGEVRDLGESLKGYTTFYRVDGVNYRPNFSAFPGSLDIPFLSTVLLRSLDLEMGEAFLRRISLMKNCEGSYALCGNQNQVLGFHGWMVEAGLIAGY